MNILDKIKKNWNHKESVEQNVIRFSNEREQQNQKINKWLIPLFCLIVIVISILTGNPLLSFAAIILSISYGSYYIFYDYQINKVWLEPISSTQFILCYKTSVPSIGIYITIGTITNGNEISFGTSYTLTTYEADIGMCLIDETHFAISVAGGAFWLYTKIGTISSGNQISFGTPANINSAIHHTDISRLTDTTFVCVYTLGNKPYAVIGTITNGNEISFGTSVELSTSWYGYPLRVFATSATTFYLVVQGEYAIGTITNGNEISFGSRLSYDNNNIVYLDAIKIGSFVAVVYEDPGSYNRLYAVILTPTYSATRVLVSAISQNPPSIALLSTNVLAFIVGNNVILGTVSGTTITISETTYAFNTGNAYGTSMIELAGSNKLLIGFAKDDARKGTAIIGTYTPPVVAPTVTTQSADQIATTSVRGNGNITATGGANCTRRGFCYKAGTSGDPTTSDSVAYDDGSFGTGAFTKSITGLTAGTDYRVRAYATNSAGTGYGSTITVTTPQSFTASVQPITSSLKDPSVNTLQQVDVSTQSLISTLKSSVINYDFVQSVLAQPLTATINDFNIIVGQIVYINPLSLSASTQSPSVTYDYVLNLNTQTLTLSKISPEAHYDYFIGVLKQELNTSLKSPSLTYDYALEVTKQELSLSQETPEIHYDFTLTLTVQSLTLEEQEPQIDILKQVFVDALSAILTLNDPQNKIIQSITDWKPNLKITNIKSRLK